VWIRSLRGRRPMTATTARRPAGRAGRPPAPARTEPPRWSQVANGLFVAIVLSATMGILLVALGTGALLGRMSTDVLTGQERATTLANSQRTASQLLLEVSAVEPGGNTTEVDVQHGLLSRQLTVAQLQFDAGSPQQHELSELRTAIDGFPWDRLREPDDVGVLNVSARSLSSYVDVRIKLLYNGQEYYFYQATLDALQAKRLSQYALAGLVLLVALLAGCWIVVFTRRTRTDLARANDRLRHQAYHDALTGLPNRTLVMTTLAEAVAHARRTHGSAAAVLIDLDGFKNVNDTLGHQSGDELLQLVAERLRECVRLQDTAARLGGDEFAVVLPGGTAEIGAAVARRLLAALRRPIGLAGQETLIGASVGVAELTGHTTAEELLADADIAMYAAKRAGKGRVMLFEREMRDRTLERGRLERLLAGAVGRGEIDVYYQPIVDLAGRRVVGVEALARWRISDTEIVEPAVFVPIAEESGLIWEIGGEVLRRACRTVRAWRAAVPGAAELGVAVNVSGWQLTADYSLVVSDVLAATGLPPEALTLEITESMLLEDSEALAAELTRLRALRVRLAMDDFGAGYSSLSSLLRFPVDTLKIDRMFLDLGAGPLVTAVAQLGRSLRLTVVAEGVETAEQLELVRAAGCDAVQGFLVSGPLPEPDARLFLEWAAATDEISTLMTPASR
jgi:diguanylate cyclase (GGDEF)-like protein